METFITIYSPHYNLFHLFIMIYVVGLCSTKTHNIHNTVADPRISQRRGALTPKGGAPTYYLANFSRKLHENEEIFGPEEGRASLAPPLDPPL